MFAKRPFFVGMALSCALAGISFGQPFERFLSGFEDAEGFADGDEVIWRNPAFSGSTQGILCVLDDTGSVCVDSEVDAFNNPWDLSQVVPWAQFTGSKSYEIYFVWTDPTSSNGLAAVRASTFLADNLERPSIHLEGKVRFNMAVTAWQYDAQNDALGPQIQDGTASILMCLGVRETGTDLPQGFADTGPGDIEFIYLPASDVVPTAGSNGLIDWPPGGKRYFANTEDWPPQSFEPDEWESIEFDLQNLGAIRGFANDGSGVDTAGDEVLDATINPDGDGVNRGVLEAIFFTNDTADTSGQIFFIYIDDVELESPVVDPVPPPTVVPPIIADDQEVTVTDLVPDVDQVILYRDGVPVSTNAVASPADLVIPISPPAVTGEAFTATQRDGASGITSAQSAPVIVLAEPSPYSFSLLIDESGSGSCSFDPPGWEWVGVTSVLGGWAPQGQFLFTDDAVWQTVDVPLDDDDLVIANFGGNGALGDSPTGFYTIDSVWFTIAPGADSNGIGPWEVFVDAVQLIDSNGMVGETILDMEDGVNRMKNARGQSTVEPPTASELSEVTSFDGLTSHRLLWSYNSPDPTEALGMLQRVEFQCGTSEQIADSSLAVRFHLLLRGQPTNPGVPLPEVVGPIIVGNQDTVRVIHDPAARGVQLYINGNTNGPPVEPTGSETDFAGLTLVPGDSVSATQTIGDSTSDFAYPRAVAALPPAPTVVGPIFPGATSVTVTDLLTVPFATATDVVLFKNGTVFPDDFIGSEVAGTETVVVPIIVGGPLMEGDVIYAAQSVDGATLGPPSAPVVVGVPAPALYKAPAEGETSVTVLDVDSNASLVKVLVDGTTNGTADPGGATSVDVTVPALVQGQVVTARMIIGGSPSALSDPETVTTNVTTEIVCDDFESYADQVAFEASAWDPTAGDVFQTLSTDQNATPGGAQSLFAPVAEDTRVEQTIANVVPTAEQPVVLTAAIYDPAGGGPGNQWVDANGLTADFWLLEVGMASCCAPSTTFYNLRLIGNGGPNWVDLDEFDAPQRSVGWHRFTVVHKGDFVDAYVDELLAKKNVPLSEATTFDVVRIGSGLVAGSDAYYDDYCLTVGPVRFGALAPQVPSPPTVRSPILNGDETVTIAGVDLQADSITVYDAADLVIGTHTITPADSNGLAEVSLTRSLVHLERITATQTNTIGESAESAALEVGDGNGDLLIAVGIRELGTQIEWIGVNTTGLGGAPQGVPISPSSGWQTFTFDPASDPITGFTGNGVIDAISGTLEHLAVAVDADSAGRSSGVYRLYMDNLENVGAAFSTGFEGFALDSEVVFQEPTFSGTTAANLSFPPSASANSAVYNNGGERSQLLTWFFRDTDESRWARITTSETAQLGSPVIDLTKPIRMDLLLVQACATVKGDMDGDCTIGLPDFDLFEACLLGPGPSAGPACICADFNDNGRVDLNDYRRFQLDFTNGAAVPGCTP